MKKNLLVCLMSLQIGFEHASNLSFMKIELLQNPLSNTAKVRVKLQTRTVCTKNDNNEVLSTGFIAKF